MLATRCTAVLGINIISIMNGDVAIYYVEPVNHLSNMCTWPFIAVWFSLCNAMACIKDVAKKISLAQISKMSFPKNRMSPKAVLLTVCSTFLQHPLAQQVPGTLRCGLASKFKSFSSVHSRVTRYLAHIVGTDTSGAMDRDIQIQ